MLFLRVCALLCVVFVGTLWISFFCGLLWLQRPDALFVNCSLFFLLVSWICHGYNVEGGFCCLLLSLLFLASFILSGKLVASFLSLSATRGGGFVGDFVMCKDALILMVILCLFFYCPVLQNLDFCCDFFFLLFLRKKAYHAPH